MIRRNRLAYEERFTQIPNAWMRDKRLSRRARGLLAEIMTHRINWRITLTSLQEGGPEGRDAISAGIKELIALGYLKRAQKRSATGRMQEIEYELCDPTATADTTSSEPELSPEITANGKPVPGPDQAESTPSTGLPTAATVNGFSVDGSAVDGSAVYGKSAPKEHHLEEHHLEEERRPATPASGPTCPSHPNGTNQPCRACASARTMFEAALAAARAEPKPIRHIPGLCDPHRQREGECDACEQDARAAARDAGRIPVVAA